MSKKCLISLFFLLFSLKVVAYIPSYSLILSHLAHFQGKGGYRIEQELFFKSPNFSLKEIWWIKNANYIRLDVRLKGLKLKEKTYLRFIYDQNKKWFKDGNGKLKSSAISYYHIERPFHLRSASALKRLFSFWKLAPFNYERKIGEMSDPFIKLSRKGGMIQYEIGLNLSRLWIEQDEFVIRSWKWETGETLSAWNYKLYPLKLFFPQNRLFTQSSSEVEIKVTNIKSLKLRKNFFKKNILKSNILDPKLAPIVQERIREFYGKFR